MVGRERIMDEVNFEDFLIRYEDKIRDVADSLSKPFGDSISILEEQISILCSKLEFLSWCLAFANGFLTNAEFAGMPARDKEKYTDKDRAIKLAEIVTNETKFKDWIEGMNKSLDKYLSNAQSVLATKRVELEKLGYGKDV